MLEWGLDGCGWGLCNGMSVTCRCRLVRIVSVELYGVYVEWTLLGVMICKYLSGVSRECGMVL